MKIRVFSYPHSVIVMPKILLFGLATSASYFVTSYDNLGNFSGYLVGTFKIP